MRQYTSVFMLYARSTFWKIFGLTLGLGAVQAGLFWWRLGAGAELDPETFELTLEEVLEMSRIHWVFGVLVVLTVVLLGRVGGGNADYTFRRLSVPYWTVIGIQALYNSLCLLMLWMAEALLVLGLCRYGLNVMGVESHQALFLACYRGDFLHNLVPMADVGRWVRNITFVLSVGFTTACAPAMNRKSKMGFLEVDVLLVFAVMFCTNPMGETSGDVAWIVGFAVMVFIALARLSAAKEDEEGSDEREETV